MSKKKKTIIWIIIAAVLVIGAVFAFSRGGKTGVFQTSPVIKQNLLQTVLATGQVVSETELKLNFQGSGVVRGVLVKEGDKVYRGQSLAYLDQSSAMAGVTSAKGTLAQARANYDKLLAGATAEDINVSQDTVLSAKQDLDNEYDSAKTTMSDAYIKSYNAYTFVAALQTSYFSASDQEGIKVSDHKNSIKERADSIKTAIASMTTGDLADVSLTLVVSDLASIAESLKIIREQCNTGIYDSKVSSADKASLDTHRTNINTVTANVAAHQQDVASLKIALQKAQNQLAFKKAPPTQAEIDAAAAQIVSAEGQLAQAKAALDSLVLWAPVSGTVTHVDIKVGQQASAAASAITLQNVSELRAEANVSEANIASLEAGQEIDYTFDALGPDNHYTGTVLTINPASVLISGVVNYKVTGSLQEVPGIKPGMTANMAVLAAKKENVLAVPSSAIISKNGKKIIRVIDEEKTKKYHEVEVRTGLQGDGGMVEIVSGLAEGQEIVVYMK